MIHQVVYSQGAGGEEIDKLRGKGRRSRGDNRPGINVEVTDETQEGVSWRE